MHIRVGSAVFAATLYDNETLTGFKSMLPLTLKMTDLNSNEKYHHLPSHLPIDASKPGTVQTGDLMLYGSNSVVLFYKTFSTPYSYTPMGKVDDASGLAAALGAGNVTVTFELRR
ncbi:cyclophilin-like fold protein [Myxococcus sp. AB056]|uniref:cyclophilin-like fold protein n=1 Tax=Myxococcus sp. AB056 TaxID=2562792 RepID=UPI0011463F41|nr:cyclophilin-like fold protein [Myxococcus sp. AB056]